MTYTVECRVALAPPDRPFERLRDVETATEATTTKIEEEGEEQ